MRTSLMHAKHLDSSYAWVRRSVLLLVTGVVLAAISVMPSAAIAAVPTGETLLGFEEPYVHEGRSVDHSGVDIRVDAGDIVACLRRGLVVFAGSIPAGPGRTTHAVTIEDAHGARWSYLPLESVDVREGFAVVEDDTLGILSPTGDRSSETPHLHLSYRQGGEYVNPLSVLEPAASAGPPARSAAETLREAHADAEAPVTRAEPAEAAAGCSTAEETLQVTGGEQIRAELGPPVEASDFRHASDNASNLRLHVLELWNRESVASSALAMTTGEAPEAESAIPVQAWVVPALMALGGLAGIAAQRARSQSPNEVCADIRSTRLQPR